MPAAQLTEYRQRLRARFAAPGIRHQLARIAVDGSAKIPARIPLEYLRGLEVRDARAAELVPLTSGPGAAALVLGALDPELAQDTELLRSVHEAAHDLSRRRATR